MNINRQRAARWLKSVTLGLAPVGLALSTLVWITPASAHVEVEAEQAVAGSAATLTFNAESESSTAGITSLNVKLPSGVAPGSVSLVKAPTGWTFTPTAVGYTVGGPAVPAGRDAEYSVRVASLPRSKQLAFPTVQGYSDGRKDSWIEQPAPGTTQEPEMPAPVLQVQVPAISTAVPTTPSSTATSASAPTARPSESRVADAKPEDSGSALLVILIVAAIVIVGGAAVLIVRRRRA